jgi:hypothetical protein
MSQISVRGDMLEVGDSNEDVDNDGLVVELHVRVHSDQELAALRRMGEFKMGFLLVEEDCCDNSDDLPIPDDEYDSETDASLDAFRD